MLDDGFRHSWEERIEEAGEQRERRRDTEMKERWKSIVEKAISFATIGPTADFNFERCRLESDSSDYDERSGEESDDRVSV